MHIPDDDEWLGETINDIPADTFFKEVSKELDGMALNPNMLDDVMKSISEFILNFTPEKLEEASKQSYEDDRNYPENFSNWYPHILDFGKFKHSDIISNQIFTWEETKVFEEEYIDKVDWNRLNEILKPTLDRMESNKRYNIKNGSFSDKFNFSTCITDKEHLAENLWKINYDSFMLETGGYTELVVRELIPNTIQSHHPKIYNGMPLREEIRVFYNMNTKSIEYMVDYWDYNYCSPNLYETSDKIIFDWFHNKYGDRLISHQEKLIELKNRIEENINTLKFDNKLTGIWSIDFLWEYLDDEIYLIDMARGFRSAYWDIDKIKNTDKGVE